ncbi:MAG: response regulator [Anaerolineales bacterium]|nr:response regulator [Anaerolineales bacterium]
MAEDIEYTNVLIIDGDASMTEMLRLILEPNDFNIFAENSGPAGIEAAQRLDPDIIILDLLMQGMDGWDICHKIREFSNVPILVLSAVNKPGYVARALDNGADDYLLKPMPSNVLIAHLKKLTRRAKAERSGADRSFKYSNA